MKNRISALEVPAAMDKNVTVAGWVHARRDHGGVIFVDLRDHSGIIQITINPEAGEAFKAADLCRDEYVIKATGTVIARERNLVNPNIPTGSVEVKVKELTILNKAVTPPFPLHDAVTVNEDLRLKYRYLDLRREKMQYMLQQRYRMIKFIRDWMDSRGFIEITTPILASSSPEGARDFLVPSRLHPGKFYALPQAPQQFKQLLMVSGVEKYFQIAPCFRDEDPRADRSPGEFYQLDTEISFAETSEEVFEAMEPLFIALTKVFKKEVYIPEYLQDAARPDRFPRIPYLTAMAEYGSDRPDLRFDMRIVDLSAILKNIPFPVFTQALKNNGVVKALCCKQASFSRKQLDELTQFVQNHGAGGLAYLVVKQLPENFQNSAAEIELGGPNSLVTPLKENPDVLTQLLTAMKAQTGDIIFFGADDLALVHAVLGKLRDKLADLQDLKDPDKIAWAWITDFPMYEYNTSEKKIDFMHNPFSMPKGGISAFETTEPLDMLAEQYDIIANGLELSSGAIRNYNPELMYKAFAVVGISKETVDEKFSAMITAFKHGAPPHGGFAPGIDRMLMLLTNEENIREVIAFPKNGSAQDLMMNAPSTVEQKQLNDLYITVQKK